MRARSGSALVASIFIIALLFVLAMGLLTKRSVQYRETDLASAALLARQLGMAGLEDARVKLDNDIGFPPVSAENQNLFSYSEAVYDLDGTTPLGSYQVTVNSTYATDPYRVLELESIGSTAANGSGGSAQLPKARYRLQAELDLSPTVRGATSPNPMFWRYLNVREQSNF